MKFGHLAIAEAAGAILAHSHVVTIDGERRKLAKGLVLTPDHIAALAAAGLTSVVAARLDAGDIGEDDAAAQLASAAAGAGVDVMAAFTGRANLVATRAGLVQIDESAVNGFNAIDESLTLSTLRPFEAVTVGQMLATVKIIPFGAPADAVRAGVELLSGGAVSVAAFRPRKVGLLVTLLPSLKTKLHDKTRRVLEARLRKSGSSVVAERRVAHEAVAVAAGLAELVAQGADLLVAFSASAVVDRADVVPAGLALGGGDIHHFGLPVDPGNLLVLGALGDVPVIGAPSCARSPKLNGFDWVLDRLVAGLPLGGREIAAMGVGGLLKEIASRPQPRAAHKPRPAPKVPRIAVVLLAAGRSVRMGPDNKLTLDFHGRPLVRWAAEAAMACAAVELVVVTGHEAELVQKALAGIKARFVDNPDYAGGLSTSLATGLGALATDIDGALIVLGDMPGVFSADLNRLIAAFGGQGERAIVVPTFDGRRGNPVLWARAFFPELMALQGDVGARHLIGEHSDQVVEVELGHGVLADIDTPEALAAARADEAE